MLTALNSNTTGSFNTAIGEDTLKGNTTGSQNTAVGDNAMLANTTGVSNTALGYNALDANTVASNNTALGTNALTALSSGGENTAVGSEALDAVTSGASNTALGTGALGNLTAGSDNLAIGWHAGLGAGSGSDNNVYIANTGTTEDNTIRIGAGTHTRAFLAGVRGVTTGVANAIPVMIDSSAQLGTVSSSRRFKTDIHDMGNVSDKLLQLRPVTFKYKPELDPSGTPQYGLIAEEVEAVFPDLVVYDEDGNVETVKYHLIANLLLNEFQKQHRTVEQIKTENDDLRAVNAALQQRLNQIERTVAAIASQAPPRAVTCGADL